MVSKKKSMPVVIFAKTENVRFGDIKPNPENPRINDEGIPKVKESIKRYGYNDYITVNKDNMILAGHTRYAALKELGVKDDDLIPVHVADHLTDKKGIAYSLVDNKSAEYSGWNFEKVEFIIKDLEDVEDLSEWFPPLEVEEADEGAYEAEGEVETYEEVPEPEEKKKTIVCPHCGEIIEL